MNIQGKENFMKHLKSWINFFIWLFLILFFLNLIIANYFTAHFGEAGLFRHEDIKYFQEEREKGRVIILNNYFYSVMVSSFCEEEEKTISIRVYRCQKENHEK